MGLRDLLKKKGEGGDGEGDGNRDTNKYNYDDDNDNDDAGTPSGRGQQQHRRDGAPPRPPPAPPLETPTFTFLRSEPPPSYTDDLGYAPQGRDERSGYSPSQQQQQQQQQQYGGFDDSDGSNHLHADGGASSPASRAGGRRSFDVFRTVGRSRSRSASVASKTSTGGDNQYKEKEKDRDGHGLGEHHRHRLSHRLHLSRTPSTSSRVPADLPEIVLPSPEDNTGGAGGNRDAPSFSSLGTDPAAAVESQWEKRATILALENERQRSRPTTPDSQQQERLGSRGRPTTATTATPRSRSNSAAVSSKELDAKIQDAIRLHEAGDLEQSTRMFGQLADPRGDNNPLSQVLYGLALRHGWGCAPDPEAAVRYLSAAASNAAAVEDMALRAGVAKGGAAKGELVLAIFELANCFRHGWGLERDPLAAKQYYETAANLGDTDAMNEVAWCYLEGFGCKKDKFAAAKYYRLAEKNGNKTLGNTWIWKEKYDPDKQKKK
ncbi:Tetratricopeptide-like helical [Niveomyces insectorum RCEF 264]|uniref:Tetratricopeptide-like helical n=1 Tax=Niveomyces insectorum RCEF 264 TaxID=1081102 RepID=A0A167WXZ2_9HYPO|nr:Tetratricopeptide-like helical [Niveomyces insectorum RCEF 264]